MIHPASSRSMLIFDKEIGGVEGKGRQYDRRQRIYDEASIKTKRNAVAGVRHVRVGAQNNH